MLTLADMAKELNRPAVYLRGLQSRFEFPVRKGATYGDNELAILRTVIHLRTLGISEDAILKLWALEKKLLQLLNVDTTGSPTWFLDACGQTKNRKRRLLLTNFDLGMALTRKKIQPGLNFGERKKELFAGKEMGEDALRVLDLYLEQRNRILRDLAAELPNVHDAARLSGDLLRSNPG